MAEEDFTPQSQKKGSTVYHSCDCGALSKSMDHIVYDHSLEKVGFVQMLIRSSVKNLRQTVVYSSSSTCDNIRLQVQIYQ